MSLSTLQTRVVLDGEIITRTATEVGQLADLVHHVVMTRTNTVLDNEEAHLQTDIDHAYLSQDHLKRVERALKTLADEVQSFLIEHEHGDFNYPTPTET